MEFSFNGSLSELKEFAQVICGSGVQTLSAVCVAETAGIAEAVPDKSQDAEIDTASLIADKPWIDPATGTYFTAFSDMMEACDALVRNSQQDDVGALLKANSANGEYCGVPPKAWAAVTKNAKELLKKKSAKKEAESADTAEAEKKEYSLEEVRELARSVQLKHGNDAVGSIFSSLGHTKLSEFQTSEYSELYARLKEAK